jgi:superfamily II DNA or RNA helicase
MLIGFMQSKGYSFKIAPELRNATNIKTEEIDQYIDSLKLPFEVRDYQREGIIQSLQSKRKVFESSTGSGKSLVIYAVSRYHAYMGEKVMIIVPNITLVTQLLSDFRTYNKNLVHDHVQDMHKHQNHVQNIDDLVHCVYAGQEKFTNKQITITTWQSMYKVDKKYLREFTTIIVDEVHLAQSSSIRSILENATNAVNRYGFTGTFKDTKSHIMVIQGLIGSLSILTKTHELQKSDVLSNIDIKMLVLEYPISKQKLSKLSYQEEISFLLSHEKRNKFLVKLISRLDGNTLVLGTRVDEQCRILYTDLVAQNPDREVYFVYGDMPKDERERIRLRMEQTDNAIIVATYQVFSTGINIRKLHNIVFSIGGKSRIRNLQSIGRGLRTHSTKSHLQLYDISDNLSSGSYENHTYKHFQERYKQYIQEKFSVSVHSVVVEQSIP